MNVSDVRKELVRGWIAEPLSAAGFRSQGEKRWEFDANNEISTLVEVIERRDLDALRLTFEWGFYSTEFAVSLGHNPRADLLKAPVRGPLGSLIRDNRFPIWWSIDRDGVVHKEWADQSLVVDLHAYAELKSAIELQLVPLARSVTDTRALIQHIPRFVESGLLNSYFANPERTIAILSGGRPSDSERVSQGGLSTPGASDSLVEVEWDVERMRWVVTFADGIAHHQEELVRRCLEHTKGSPGVEEAYWQDREMFELSGSAIDPEALRRALLAIVAEGVDNGR